MKTNCQHLNTKKYYVYRVFFQDQLIYVGKGKGDRVKHVLSGCSHNKHLNEVYYYCKFNTIPFPEITLEYCLTEKHALDLEHNLIYQYQPYCNTQLKSKLPLEFEERFLPKDDTVGYTCFGDNYWEEESL